jgi:hypothetical protein
MPKTVLLPPGSGLLLLTLPNIADGGLLVLVRALLTLPNIADGGLLVLVLVLMPLQHGWTSF